MPLEKKLYLQNSGSHVKSVGDFSLNVGQHRVADVPPQLKGVQNGDSSQPA